MGIKVSGNDMIADFADKALKILSDNIKEAFYYLGEESVNKARLPHLGDWKDDTGNLRSSIGYTVYEHGKQQILSAFEVVRNGHEGREKGIALAEELARKYSNTFVLVVVAGVDYASYVEACKNRDVLASATLDALSKMDRYMNNAIDKSIKQINSLKV